MSTEINLACLKQMSATEFESYRAAGEDMRRELTHAVMHDLNAPDLWDMNGEYRSEFGGFFPVQVRFTPSHGRFHLAVCSPGDICEDGMVVLIPASGRPFSVIRTLPEFDTALINHTLSLVARLDADGYSAASIISILAMERA